MRFYVRTIFMKINETLLYKGIICCFACHFYLRKKWKSPDFTKGFSCLLFRVSENGFAKIKKKWIIALYSNVSWNSIILMGCTKVPGKADVLELFVVPCFPGVAQHEDNSGESTKRYYIKLLLSFTNPCSGNAEHTTTKAFPQFWSFSCFAVKRGKWIIALYSNVSLNFQTSFQFMTMWKVNNSFI